MQTWLVNKGASKDPKENGGDKGMSCPLGWEWTREGKCRSITGYTIEATSRELDYTSAQLDFAVEKVIHQRIFP